MILIKQMRNESTLPIVLILKSVQIKFKGKAVQPGL